MDEKLFVYGTLLQKHIQAEVDGMSVLRFVGEGSVEEELYELGMYPGAVQKAGGVVYGEVYELADAAQILRKLDEYEGYNPQNLKGSLYVRKTVEVRLNDNTKTAAYAYFYNKTTRNHKKIPGGKWSR